MKKLWHAEVTLLDGPSVDAPLIEKKRWGVVVAETEDDARTIAVFVLFRDASNDAVMKSKVGEIYDLDEYLNSIPDPATRAGVVAYLKTCK